MSDSSGRGKGGKVGKGVRAPVIAIAHPENADLVAFLDDKRAECLAKQQENLMWVYVKALKSVRAHDAKIHSAVRRLNPWRPFLHAHAFRGALRQADCGKLQGVGPFVMKQLLPFFSTQAPPVRCLVPFGQNRVHGTVRTWLQPDGVPSAASSTAPPVRMS